MANHNIKNKLHESKKRNMLKNKSKQKQLNFVQQQPIRYK